MRILNEYPNGYAENHSGAAYLPGLDMVKTNSSLIVPRGHLSASSIGKFLTCPKQYEFAYVLGVKKPRSAALVTGSAMHKVLESYYREVLDGRERLTASQTAELVADTVDDELAEDESLVTETDERDDIIRTLENLAEVYVDCVASHLVPLAIEEERTYEAPCGVPVVGYIDLRCASGGITDRAFAEEDTDRQMICDYKITAKKWSLAKLQNSLQFNLYSAMTGIGEVNIHNMLKQATSRFKPSDEEGISDIAPNLRIVRNRFDGAAYDHMNDMIRRIATCITAGVFPPCSLDSWACTPDFCDYWELCRGKKS